MHLFTHSALLKALGWSLLNSMWQMAFVWLLYLLVTALLNTFYKRTTAGHTHSDSSHANSASGLHHSIAILFLGVGSVWSVVSFIRYLSAIHYQSAGVSDPLSPLVSLPAVPVLPAISALPAALISQALPFLSCLYLAILFFGMARYLYQYRQSDLLRRRGLFKADPELRLFVDTTRRSLGIHKKVGFWLSSFVEAPLTIGFLKPFILLPVAILNNLDPKQVEAILLHELAHIKRNDYLLNLLITFVDTLFFFNPFAKLLTRSIAREREHNCDDLVLQFRYDPHSYASALLLLARSHRESPQLTLSATGCDDQLLLQRVKRIMKLKTNSGPSPKKFALCLLLASSAATLSLFQSPSSWPSSLSLSSSSAGPHLLNSPTMPPAINHSGKPDPIANPESIANPVGVPGRNSDPLTVAGLLPGSARSEKSIRHPRTTPGRRIMVALRTARQANPEPGQVTNVMIVTQAEHRDFSIVLPVKPIVPGVNPGHGEDDLPGQPFVPASSFSYLLTANDDLVKGFSREEIGQAIRLLAAIDWQNLEKQRSETGQAADAFKWVQLKKQVLQKILELNRAYRNSQPDPKPIHQMETSPGKRGRQLVIVYI